MIVCLKCEVPIELINSEWKCDCTYVIATPDDDNSYLLEHEPTYWIRLEVAIAAYRHLLTLSGGDWQAWLERAAKYTDIVYALISLYDTGDISTCPFCGNDGITHREGCQLKEVIK